MHSRAIFSPNLEANLTRAINLSQASKIVLVTDENTSLHCKSHLDNIKFDLHYVLPKGEANKKIETLTQLLSFLTNNKADKKTLLIALGGGMVTDLVGFAASIYKRGISYINIPTTLLSMVDASVGGKTGIDFNGIKNMIGSFYPPICILSNADFLTTLPVQELKSGWAEVLKHLLISNMILPESITKISNKDLDQWSGIKYTIIRTDPYEKGIRLALNAGHTVGHAIEGYLLANKKPIPHGFAIAAGLWIEAHICKELLNDDWSYNSLQKPIDGVFNKLLLTEGEIDCLIELMTNDKKNKNGNIVCSLLKKGGILNVTEVNQEYIKQAIHAYIKA